MKKIFLIFFLISLTTYSQRIKPVYGTILDSIGYLKDVNILNKTSKIGTNSNAKGEFKIFCQLGDTLVFSSVQHQLKEIIINENSFKSFNSKIYLKFKTYELDEFELKKNNLLGILELDISKVKQNENEINAKTLELPNAGLPKLKQVDREIYTATKSGGIVSLDLILNTITGRLRKLKEKKKIVEDNEDVNLLINEFRYNLTTNFKINKKDHYRFLYYCRSDSSYTTQLSKNKFEFINFLKVKAIEFNKLKND